jgi:hypothetical protein
MLCVSCRGHSMAAHMGVKVTDHSFGGSPLSNPPFSIYTFLTIWCMCMYVSLFNGIADVVLLSAAARAHVSVDVTADGEPFSSSLPLQRSSVFMYVYDMACHNDGLM